MINGRGYPDTVNPDPLPTPTVDGASVNNDHQSQKISALVTATAGEKILLRLSNLSVTNFYTVTALGLPMRVVGGGAHIARGPDGKNLYYDTSSVTLGGGETVGRDHRHGGRRPGHVLLLHHQPQLPEQRRPGLRRNDDRDRHPVARPASSEAPGEAP